METMIRIDVNFIKEYWCLFFESSMEAEKMDPNGKKLYIGHGSGTIHCQGPNILEMSRPEIGCYIGNKTDKISCNERERHITD